MYDAKRISRIIGGLTAVQKKAILEAATGGRFTHQRNGRTLDILRTKQLARLVRNRTGGFDHFVLTGLGKHVAAELHGRANPGAVPTVRLSTAMDHQLVHFGKGHASRDGQVFGLPPRTLAALVRRGVVGPATDRYGRAGDFITVKGWQYLATAHGMTRPADDWSTTPRLSAEQALTEAYEVNAARDFRAAMDAITRTGDTARLADLVSYAATLLPHAGAAVDGAPGEFLDLMARAAGTDHTETLADIARRAGALWDHGPCPGHDDEPLPPGEVHYCNGTCTPAPAAPERRVIEGVVVGEHAGTTEGSHPRHAGHPDVVVARAALDRLKAAALTDDHDVTEPTGAEQDVRGYLIDPREHGRIAVYWLEQGRTVRRDTVDGTALDILAERLRSHGWTVTPMPRSSPCVFAQRPGEPGGRPAPVVARMGFSRADLDRIGAKAGADRAAWREEMKERRAAERARYGAPDAPAAPAVSDRAKDALSRLTSMRAMFDRVISWAGQTGAPMGTPAELGAALTRWRDTLTPADRTMADALVDAADFEPFSHAELRAAASGHGQTPGRPAGTLRLDTSQIRSGDIVLAHGMRVLVTGEPGVSSGAQGAAVYAWHGTVVNLAEVLTESHVHPSFLRTYRGTALTPAREDEWTIQGNEYAHWTVERAGDEPGADVLERLADLRGRFGDGYTPDDIRSVFGRIGEAGGPYLVCVWDYADDCGFGGNSQFYAEDEDGRLYEIRPDVHQWLSGQQDIPGPLYSWVCGRAAGPKSFPVGDDFHNYARRDGQG